MTPCIWSLLSVRELEFINASGFSHHLKGLSLFQLIHPDELLMAQRDLFRFTHSHLLSGSVTRCRLRDYTSHDFSTKSNAYIIVDIIMYVATGDTVLAFLHYPESLIEQEQKQHSPSLSTSSSLSSIESSQQHQNECDAPHQFLYILDSQTKSVLLSWPDHYHNEMGSADYLISSLDDRPMLPGISCFRCVQRPSQTNSSGQRLHSLIVEYGSITFLLASLDKKNTKQHFNIPPLAQSISTKPVSLPCSPNKYNQLDEYPLRRTSEPYTAASSSPSHIHYLKPRKYQPYPTIPLENLLLPNNSDKQQQYLSSHHPKHHCQSCGTDSSPEWRRGPTGHKTFTGSVTHAD
ncbi:GATA-type zinc finger transcription factor [Mucor lusitanicus CBS 277.49]|uniref:GATA-type zinc finger transcription factor n=1 Tax=Mucor lusitanicus CBS 277.49 TaxID=747725 RepID=A0A168GH21_MUCCL|nr:GATA-type zinc finger transcription factor [Mucor lusitanicus CBS 277.49]